uniref:Uncharacterized protein n=1 Tax=Arundo donax TaxID=35708 RepID=A0A0A8Z9Y4_ARUDO
MKASRQPNMWLVASLSRYQRVSSRLESPSSCANTLPSTTRRGRRSSGI